MEYKKILIAILVLLGALHIPLHGQKKTDRENMQLAGKVKTLTETTSYMPDGDASKLFYSISHFTRTINFDDCGNKLSETWYNNPQGEFDTYPSFDFDNAADLLYAQWKYEYDSITGLLNSCIQSNKSDSIIASWKYTYDEKDIRKWTEYKNFLAETETTWNYTLKNGLVIEENILIKKPQDSTNRKHIVYHYNSSKQKTSTIENIMTSYEEENEEGEIQIREEIIEQVLYNFKYDNNGNLIEEEAEYEMGRMTLYHSYDRDNRLINTKTPDPIDDVGYNLKSYVYDRYGNILKINSNDISDSASSSISRNKEVVFGYDIVDQNWVKKTEFSQNGNSVFETYRYIEYYE